MFEYTRYLRHCMNDETQEPSINIAASLSQLHQVPLPPPVLKPLPPPPVLKPLPPAPPPAAA
jgi:hypothetical protein